MAVKQSKHEVLATSKVSFRYQITIPKRVRERFTIREDDLIVFLVDNGKLTLQKANDSTI